MTHEGYASRSICGVEPVECSIAMEPVAKRALSQPVDRRYRVEHRRLDAGRGRWMADDVVIVLASDGGPGGSGRQLSPDAARTAGRCARRYHRSAPAADRHSSLSAVRCGYPGCADMVRNRDALGAHRFHVRPWDRRGDDAARLGRDHPRSGCARRNACRRRPQQHRN